MKQLLYVGCRVKEYPFFGGISFQHLSESGGQHSDCQIAEESSRDAKLSDC